MVSFVIPSDIEEVNIYFNISTNICLLLININYCTSN